MPTVLFTTERFAELTTVTADELEMTDLRVVVVPHPLGGTDPDVVAQWGRDAVETVVELLSP